MKSTNSRLARSLTLILAAGIGLVTPLSVSAGDFSTGVSDDRVSLPEGPGSLEGLGENVEIDPNMATMRWKIAIEVPPGFKGITPELALSYSSGAGSGIVGIGWSFDVSSIERMTAHGLPQYTEEDRFTVGGGTELVRVSPAVLSSSTPAIYRARFEKEFVRYSWLSRGTGALAGQAGYWKAEYPDGRVGYFGADHLGQLVPEARVGVGASTFRYQLVDMVDGHGNRLHYDYTVEDNYPYVTTVGYVFDANDLPGYSVALAYESRTDQLSDCRGGYEELIDKRLNHITVYSGTQPIRQYLLTYDSYTASGGLSRLGRVDQLGVGGATTPLIDTLSYSQALGSACTRADCGQPYLVDMGTLGVSVRSGKATLVDINGDAMPDLVDTSDLAGDGKHRFYVSEMLPNGTHRFNPTAKVSNLGTAGSHTLGTKYVQLLDVNGDGFTDLVNGDTKIVLENLGAGDWAAISNLSLTRGFPTLSAGAEVRFLDYDNDKRIDMVVSETAGTVVYQNVGDGFVEDTGVDALGSNFSFSNKNVQFADMNGDGLLDIVAVQPDQLLYRLNLGWGHWATETSITLDISDLEDDLALLEDINGDALTDVILVTGNTASYYLNRNGASFDPRRNVTSAAGGSMPERNTDTTVLCADMNGNGSQDIVWISPNGQVIYLELFPIRPNLLTRIENGLGRVTQVTYGTSVQHQAASIAAGRPWVNRLPFPMVVVDRVDEWDLVTQVQESTEYDYYDGFYDGVEKQYRGYEQVIVTQEGDESSETGITTSDFNVGKTDPYMNGLLLHKEVTSDGRPIDEETLTYGEWEDCPVAEVPTPTELQALGRRPIRQVCELRRELVQQEGAPEASWATIVEERVYDGYGNIAEEKHLGVTAIGGGGCVPCATGTDVYGEPCGESCSGDEKFTHSYYLTPANSGGRWLVHTVYKSQVSASEGASNYSEEITYFDGTTDFLGLPEGQATLGDPTRVTERIDASGAVFNAKRYKYDAHGNISEAIDGLGVAGGSTHRRIYTYDDGLHLTRTDVLTQDPQGAPYVLRREITYDPLFGKPSSATGWIRVVGGQETSPRNSSFFTYDPFGRVASIVRPGGDTVGSPTESFTYELASPVSRIVTRRRSQVGGAQDIEVIGCINGRGRKIQDRTALGNGTYLVTGFSTFTVHGEKLRVYQPYTSTSAQCDTQPPTDVLYVLYRYDALNRERLLTYPDADVYGEPSRLETVYEPLGKRVYDPEDGDPASAHYDTPEVERLDGLNRIVALARKMSAAEDPEMVRVTYDAAGNVRGYIDAGGHERVQHYDLAQRMVQLDDPNAGTATMEYDLAGNLIARTDGRGLQIRAAYDGLNRLLERWEDGKREETLLQATYDAAPQCTGGLCSNTAGVLAALRYHSGEDWFGYDVRGKKIYAARNLDEAQFVTEWQFDNTGRNTSTIYPDGRELTRTYDPAGRPLTIAGVLDDVTYDPRGLPSAITFHNGVTEERGYDALMRASSTSVLTETEALSALSVDRDRAGNVLAVHDTTPNIEERLALDANYSYDAWYRVLAARLNEGRASAETVTYRYDVLDNILSATSSVSQSKANVGEYQYDPLHPNAVTKAGALTASYDLAGHMTQRGGTTLTWDAFGQLASAATAGGDPIGYAYASNNERVIRSETHGYTQYVSDEYEVRDGIGVIQVRLEGKRIAQLDSDVIQAQVLSDVAPSSAPDGVITAGDAWVAYAARTGLLQGVEAGTTSPERLLLGAARRMLYAAQTTEHKAYLHYDHLGSVVLATDAAGAVRGRQAYFPTGMVRASTGVLGEYGFTGQEADETGLLHFGHRYLDPEFGRWVSPDPAFDAINQENIEKFGEATVAYAYVANGFATHVDPSGLGIFGKISAAWSSFKGAVGKAIGKWAIKHPKWATALRVGVALGAAAAAITLTIASFGIAAAVAVVVLAAVNTAFEMHSAAKDYKTLKTGTEAEKAVAAGSTMLSIIGGVGGAAFGGISAATTTATTAGLICSEVLGGTKVAVNTGLSAYDYVKSKSNQAAISVKAQLTEVSTPAA